jgi:hypothetical protein
MLVHWFVFILPEMIKFHFFFLINIKLSLKNYIGGFIVRSNVDDICAYAISLVFFFYFKIYLYSIILPLKKIKSRVFTTNFYN